MGIQAHEMTLNGVFLESGGDTASNDSGAKSRCRGCHLPNAADKLPLNLGLWEGASQPFGACCPTTGYN